MVAGALILGAVLGGFVGALIVPLAGGDRARQVSAPAIPAASGETDVELAEAIRALAEEVRTLGMARPERPASARVSASPEDDASDPTTNTELIAALDRLSAALQSAPGRSLPGGIGLSSISMPARGKNVPALLALMPRDPEEVSREHRFWSVQRTLDHYGPPDEVDGNGNWLYELEYEDGTAGITFIFRDGYLLNIWN